MPDTAQLASDLTHALQPLLPAEHVATSVQGVVAALAYAHDFELDAVRDKHEAARAATVQDWALAAVRAALPEPYRSLASVAAAVGPVVAKWWRERVVEASEITVLDERAPD